MRIRRFVGLATIGAAAACAHGVSDDQPELTLDSTEGPQSDSGLRVPPPTDGSVASDGAPGDASTSDGPSDAPSTIPDAAGDAAGDAGADVVAPDADAAVSLLGQSCAMPIDVSAGGLFAIDTCALKNSLPASCVAGGTGPGAALRGDAPSSGSTYFVTVPTGWVVQQANSACGDLPVSCNPGAWGVSGFAGQPSWWFVIEKADGTCGATTVTVNRSM